MASTRSRRALPRLLERLRAGGLGEQAFKAALAAGIAWVLGGFVPAGPPAPTSRL